MTYSFDADDLMRSATLEVAARVRRTWRLRLGLWLICLATRVIGRGFGVTTLGGPGPGESPRGRSY